jgi:hypothetical protein
MKHYARPVPGSGWSCRTVLSRSSTPPGRFQGQRENATKMQPKCSQKRECDSFNCSALATYNFNAVNWLHFHGALPVWTVERQSLSTESQGARLRGPGDCCSFSLGEKVRMRDKLVPLSNYADGGNKPYYTVQNETKRDDFRLLQKLNALYQPLTTTPRPAVPFFEGTPWPVADEVTSLTLKSLSGEDGWSDSKMSTK